MASTDVTAPGEGRPQAWNPARDETHPRSITGRVVRYELVHTDYGDRFAVWIEDQAGCLFSRLIGGSALESQFERERPKPGQLIRLAYLGPQESRRTGRTYQGWRLEVDRRGQEPDWEGLVNGEARWRDAEPEP